MNNARDQHENKHKWGKIGPSYLLRENGDLSFLLFFRNNAWWRTFRESFKKIHRELFFLRDHLNGSPLSLTAKIRHRTFHLGPVSDVFVLISTQPPLGHPRWLPLWVTTQNVSSKNYLIFHAAFETFNYLKYLIVFVS